MKRAVVVLVALLAGGCGSHQQGPAPVAVGRPVKAPATSAAVVPSPSPVAAVQELGSQWSDGEISVTVSRFKPHSAATNTSIKGYVFSSVLVRSCALVDGLDVSWKPWSLGYDDGSVIKEADFDLPAFPQPEYPLDYTKVLKGSCVSGWITFETPPSPAPSFVMYAPTGSGPARWLVA